MRDVVITGMGLLTPCGSDPETFWRNLSAARSGLDRVTRIDGSRLASNVAGEVRDYDAQQHFGKEIDLLDRFAQFGVVCARRALADAGLPLKFSAHNGIPAERVAVITGTGLGGVESQDSGFYELYGRQATRLHPFSIPRMMFNAATSHISMDTGAQGPAFTTSTACSSASHAIGEALRILQSGAADVVLSGGSDAPIALSVFKAWEAMRVLAPAGNAPERACRPFSADRAGLVLAEGAAIFVLETEEHACRRGAKPYARLAGFGASADAGHITQPSRVGPLRAMRQAMTEAGIAPSQLDYINAHGTATRLNDATEIATIRELLGEHAAAVSISSTKSMHGHAMGASGAIEFAATLLAIKHQTVPPTANYNAPDPECALDVTPNRARPRRIRTAISNSFAFGGLNAVLALRALD